MTEWANFLAGEFARMCPRSPIEAKARILQEIEVELARHNMGDKVVFCTSSKTFLPFGRRIETPAVSDRDRDITRAPVGELAMQPAGVFYPGYGGQS